MLSELTVKGFGIIEEVSWRPSAGLNVITGETGAGKSLVVDAVEALLSGQVAEEDIRHGSDFARLEGVFLVPDGASGDALRALLAEKGLDAGEDSLLLSGDFRRRGRAAPRVNRQAVSRALLREIGARLVDIHGQSGHLSLLNEDRHLDFLDAYARTGELRRRFGAGVAGLAQAVREAKDLREAERDLARRTELLNFQIDEIRRAELQPGEEETLTRELALMASGEKLKAAACEIYARLYGDEDAMPSASAVDRLGEALPSLRQIAEADPAWQPKLEYLEELLHGLEELAREARSYADTLDYDPRRLEEAQNRLELIRGLKRKYGGSIDEILAFQADAGQELDGLTHSTQRREALEAEIARRKIELGAMASELSGERHRAAEKLAAAVMKECGDLNMAQVIFEVAVTQEPDADGLPFPDGRSYKFNAGGADAVAFLAATNPGEPLKPLAKIASTGEISRFMLALKSALAGADPVPVLIFDEIDIGVGGRSGEVIGRKLWNLSRRHQVICVTHLPQIAAFADAHYTVSKRSTGERTVSTIAALEGEARLKELAVMVGGADYAADSLSAARELAQKAGDWKQAAGY